MDKSRKMVLRGHEFYRRDIPKYFDDYFGACLSFYIRYKRYGLPESGGWMNQQDRLLKIIDLFEDESSKFRAEEAKKNKK